MKKKLFLLVTFLVLIGFLYWLQSRAFRKDNFKKQPGSTLNQEPNKIAIPTGLISCPGDFGELDCQMAPDKKICGFLLMTDENDQQKMQKIEYRHPCIYCQFKNFLVNKQAGSEVEVLGYQEGDCP